MVSVEIESFKFQQNLNSICSSSRNSNNNKLRCISMRERHIEFCSTKEIIFCFLNRVWLRITQMGHYSAHYVITLNCGFPFDSPKLASVQLSISFPLSLFYSLCVYLNIVHFALVFVTSVWVRVEYQLVDTSTRLATPCVSHPFFVFVLFSFRKTFDFHRVAEIMRCPTRLRTFNLNAWHHLQTVVYPFNWHILVAWLQSVWHIEMQSHFEWQQCWW